jgi:hypothetical protein
MNKSIFSTNILGLLIIITLFTSCKTVKISAPEAKNIEVPTIKQSISNLNLPITIDLTPYLKDTEKSIPQKFNGKEDNCSGVSYAYRFERNPIIFDGRGSYLTYEVTGKYALNLNYCPECTFLFDSKGTCVVPRIYASCGVGEPMRKVNVAYATKVDISRDYKLNSTTQLVRFETIDPCEITVFKYDATAKLKKEVTGVLKSLEKEIDASISEVDIRSSVEEVWKTISSPQAIGEYGFLNLRPKQISISSVQFDKKQALLNLNLAFEASVSTTKREVAELPLPALTEHKMSNGFEIFLDIEADYDSLTNILTKEIAGRTLEIKKNVIRLDAVGIASSSGKKLNLWVQFSGKKKGILYLVGTPVFDEENQVISFPDLEFDIKTKNALLKSAEWLFSRKITDLVRKEATFDLKPELDKMKSTLGAGLNGPISKGVDIQGRIEHLRINSIYPDNDQLIIRTSAKGHATVRM